MFRVVGVLSGSVAATVATKIEADVMAETSYGYLKVVPVDAKK